MTKVFYIFFYYHENGVFPFVYIANVIHMMFWQKRSNISSKIPKNFLDTLRMVTHTPVEGPYDVVLEWEGLSSKIWPPVWNGSPSILGRVTKIILQKNSWNHSLISRGNVAWNHDEKSKKINKWRKKWDMESLSTGSCESRDCKENWMFFCHRLPLDPSIDCKWWCGAPKRSL